MNENSRSRAFPLHRQNYSRTAALQMKSGKSNQCCCTKFNFSIQSDHIKFQTKEITWDSARSFPPVRCCLFSHGITGITFLGDPSAGSGMPRGTIVYATQAVPQQVRKGLLDVWINDGM